MTSAENGEMAAQERRVYADVNAVVGGYLRDLAFAQSSQQKMFGYKRAAAAIFGLEMPLTDLAGPDGAWPRSFLRTADRRRDVDGCAVQQQRPSTL